MPDVKPSSGMCPTMRHIRSEHSSLNIKTGAVSGVEKVIWSTERCQAPLFGRYREIGQCASCLEGWEAPGSRLASTCSLHEAQEAYASRAQTDCTRASS